MIINNQDVTGSNPIDSGNLFPEIMDEAIEFLDAGLDKEGVDRLVYLHQCGYERESVESILFDPIRLSQSAMSDRYQKNINLLKNYPYFHVDEIPEFTALNLRFIPTTGSCFKVFDAENRRFIPSVFDIRKQAGTSNTQPSDVPLLVNAYSSALIEYAIESTHDTSWILGMREPVYAFYSNPDTFFSFLQLLDLENVLSKERVVFLLGESQFFAWMKDCRYSLPSTLINAGDSGSDLIQWVREADHDRQTQVQQSLQTMTSYYKNLGKAGVLQRLRNTPCRIFVLTTLFSTAVQYYARDSAEALKDLGHEVRLWIEDNPLQKISGAATINEIASFKPDLVLLIDHFRFESPIYPPELAVASWIQDPLPWIMNSESPKKLGDMDLIMNAFFSSPEIRELGYPREREVRAPLAVNEKRFEAARSMHTGLTSDTAPIIAFSNAGNPHTGYRIFCERLKDFIQSDPRIEPCLAMIFKNLYKKSLNGNPVFLKNEISDLLSASFARQDMQISGKGLSLLAEEFQNTVNHRILRSVPLEWLSDAGLDLAIYGDEWLDHPKLKKHAMGRADNEYLPSIIASAKIVVGTNGHCSTHPRVGESVLGGALYLGWAIPEGADVGSLSDYVSSDDGILFYKEKEDLLGHVKYFLQNDEHRAQLVKKAATAIRDKLSYRAVMKDMINGAGKLLG